MYLATVYTVLAVVNLIGAAVGISLLPERVATHFNASGLADRLGSPWEYIAFPAITALLAVGVWAIALRSKKNREYFFILFVTLGVLFATLGWVFFGLAARADALGEAASVPYAAVVILPFSLGIVVLGSYLPRIKPNSVIGIRTPATLKSERVWEKTHRAGRYAMVAAGLLSAAAAIVFSCLDTEPRLDYVSVIVFVGLLLAVAVFCCVYAHIVSRREGEAEPTDEEA